MLSNTPDAMGKPTATVFNKVAENLYRLESTGAYYGLLKRAGKQFRRSLKTTDRKLAERRLAALRQQISHLSLSEDANASFDEVARRWLETTRYALKASTVRRQETCIKNLAPTSRVRPFVTPRHCEQWTTERGREIAPQG